MAPFPPPRRRSRDSKQDGPPARQAARKHRGAEHRQGTQGESAERDPAAAPGPRRHADAPAGRRRKALPRPGPRRRGHGRGRPPEPAHTDRASGRARQHPGCQRHCPGQQRDPLQRRRGPAGQHQDRDVPPFRRGARRNSSRSPGTRASPSLPSLLGMDQASAQGCPDRDPALLHRGQGPEAGRRGPHLQTADPGHRHRGHQQAGVPQRLGGRRDRRLPEGRHHRPGRPRADPGRDPQRHPRQTALRNRRRRTPHPGRRGPADARRERQGHQAHPELGPPVLRPAGHPKPAGQTQRRVGRRHRPGHQDRRHRRHGGHQLPGPQRSGQGRCTGPRCPCRDRRLRARLGGEDDHGRGPDRGGQVEPAGEVHHPAVVHRGRADVQRLLRPRHRGPDPGRASLAGP